MLLNNKLEITFTDTKKTKPILYYFASISYIKVRTLLIKKVDFR